MMKIKRETLISIILITGLILVLSGAYFKINHLYGNNALLISGFATVLVYTIATIKETRKQNKFNSI